MQSWRIAGFIPKPLQSVCLLPLMKVVAATSAQMFADGLMQKKKTHRGIFEYFFKNKQFVLEAVGTGGTALLSQQKAAATDSSKSPLINQTNFME